MTHGEYAFIVCMKDVDEVERNLKYQFKWYISHYTETLHTSSDVEKALEAALILAPKLPEAEYSKFVYRLRIAMGMAPFFSTAYIGKINGTHMDKSQSTVGYYLFANLSIKSSQSFLNPFSTAIEKDLLFINKAPHILLANLDDIRLSREDLTTPCIKH